TRPGVTAVTPGLPGMLFPLPLERFSGECSSAVLKSNCSMSSHPESQPFDAPLEELRTRLYKIAHMMLGEVAAAEDVAQETIARAIEHVGSFHGGDFFAWVCTIAVNLCRARRNAVQRGPVSMDPSALERHRLASKQPGPATRIIRNEAHERAAVAM